MPPAPRSRAALCALAAASVSLVAGCGDDAPADRSANAATTASAARCSTAALRGTYLYEVHGDEQFAGRVVPYLEIGVMHADGHGQIKRLGTQSLTRAQQPTSETFTVDATCSGEIRDADGGRSRATLSPGGEEVTFFAAGHGKVQDELDGKADRVSDAGPTCSLATLHGTYQYRARGIVGGRVHIEHGFEVYDGHGHVTNAFRVAGVDTREHLTGTYRVDRDCHAVVTYAGNHTIEQYLAPAGDEFYWIQTKGLRRSEMFGGHEHRVSDSTDTTLTTGA
jgi:hypothetical protein